MNAIKVDIQSIPDALKQRDQWVCWRYQRPSDGNTHRWCKLPVSPVDGRNAKTTSPTTWSDFGTAMTRFQRNPSSLAGVGFVFSRDDPFIGIDMDKCRNEQTGELSPWAQQVVNELDSYTEVSPSGTGIKCILRSSTPVASRRRSSDGIEVYSSSRFFTITGQVVGKQPAINDRTEAVRQAYARWFPTDHPDTQPGGHSQLSDDLVPDNVILNRAMSAGNGWKFKKLWKGDTSLHRDNASEADLALCRILAFWTGPNPDQIDRLFRRSNLYRPKWDETHYADGTTYGQQTVQRAITAQGETFFRWPTGMRRETAITV